MKLNYFLPRIGVILLVIVTLASCEEDFTNIATDIIDQNFNTEFDDSRTVRAYSKKIASVQSNNLPAYQLGIYNDPIYGKTTANLLSQVVLGTGDTNPDFGDCTVLDSVVLYLPFFNEETVVDTVSTFTLDSIFGDSPVDIAIYESNYFLRDLDPDLGFEEVQRYYSDQGPLFESQIFNMGFSNLIHTIEDFTPSAEPHQILVSTTNEAGETVETIQQLPPGIRVQLPIEFFEEKIIQNEGSISLLNNNNFREFFRGLYFKVTSTSEEGNLFLFDLDDSDNDPLNDARINLYYSFKSLQGEEMCGDEGLDEFEGDLELLFNAISVNVFEDDVPFQITSALENANTSEGEETLYVRGGEGIVTVIELFGDDLDGNGVADELDDLRDKAWLINEANLIFYVDQNTVNGGSAEPERLVIYDTKNNRLLADYNTDLTSNLSPVDAFTDHLGRLERGSDGNGEFYKIRITSHLSNIINNDSLNVPLGLIVSQNVTVPGFRELRDSIVPREGVIITEVPSTSVIAPQGTVLFGNSTTNMEKRLKLQIYYTEPQ